MVVRARAAAASPAPAAQQFPLPPYSATRFLNTGPEAQYIGTAACAVCHSKNHESYLLTAHSRALSDVDLSTEPPDGSFENPTSGRFYRVYRQDGQLRQEESLRNAAGQKMAVVDLPARFLIGSGHYSRSYLVEVDGFLHESPITWYASKQQWSVSPGYDTPHPVGFERPVSVDCLTCHAGRAEATDGSVHRIVFREKAIGCENCHGPGSLHQEWHRTHQPDAGADDLTIVHPGKLSRPLREAICAECHLNGPARVYLRGRKANDYRPGRPQSDYRIDYSYDSRGTAMTVVGHIEQLHQSRCYQQTKELTCITCHDPHQPEKPKDPVAFYRQKCLECHATKPCGLDETQRRKQQPADNCAACHMKRGDTDIPHIAFTHHRIGLHGTKQPTAPDRVPDLVPIEDVSGLSDTDRERNLGLAYLIVSRKSPYAQPFRERARQHLENVRAEGLHDAETALGLAELYNAEDPTLAAAFAKETLEEKDAPANVRALALMVLGNGAVQGSNFRAAIGPFEELIRMRRAGGDWRQLGLCYLREGDPAKARPVLEQALSIRPTDPAIHRWLAEAYLKLGAGDRAQEHQEKAKWLAEHGQ